MASFFPGCLLYMYFLLEQHINGVAKTTACGCLWQFHGSAADRWVSLRLGLPPLRSGYGQTGPKSLVGTFLSPTPTCFTVAFPNEKCWGQRNLDSLRFVKDSVDFALWMVSCLDSWGEPPRIVCLLSSQCGRAVNQLKLQMVIEHPRSSSAFWSKYLDYKEVVAQHFTIPTQFIGPHWIYHIPYVFPCVLMTEHQLGSGVPGEAPVRPNLSMGDTLAGMNAVQLGIRLVGWLRHFCQTFLNATVVVSFWKNLQKSRGCQKQRCDTTDTTAAIIARCFSEPDGDVKHVVLTVHPLSGWFTKG